MRVKNVSGATKVYVGQSLTNNQEYDIPANERYRWQADDTVIVDVASGALLVGDGSSYKTAGASATNYLLGIDTTPKDISGRNIYRQAATVDGWHYQLLSTEITTAKKDGFFSQEEDGTSLGFVTHKIYDANDAEITDAANEGQAVKTVVWVKPTHSYEIIGAVFGQKDVPTSDIRLWVTGLPGIANVKFARGGMNLKHAGSGTYQLADGRASKYLAYNAQAPDANAFKVTIKHPQGTQHSFQLSLEVYKAV